MKKIIGFVTLMLFVACSQNKKEIKNKEREQYIHLLKNHPYQEVLKLSKQESKLRGLPPNKYFEQEYLLEINPKLGRTTPENLFEIQNDLKKKGAKFQRTPGDGIDNSWVERGPNNVGGRTRAILFDPNDKNNANAADDYTRVFAGGVSGGLWVNDDITDENVSWTRVGISENLAVSSITVDPNNSSIWYAGTGESYTTNDGAGSGLWKSTNAGNSWFNLLSVNFDEPNAASRLYTINDVFAWNNEGNTEVFMAVSREYDYGFIGYNFTGLWKSTDNGSNWSRVSLFTDSDNPTPYEINTIEVAADNSIWVSTRTNAFGEGGGKIFKSIDGSAFVEKYSFTDGHRVEISCSTISANTIYALAELKTGSFPYSTPYLSMVKTTDGFETGTIPETVELSLPNDADTGIDSDDFTRGQAFYDLLIEVDPTNDAVVYAGGIDLFRSSDSGETWSQISKWSNNNDLANLVVSEVHADQHEMVFRPNSSNEALFGNDGGVYYASNLTGASASTDAINPRIKDYNVTQFYKGSIGQDENTELFLAGAQDNGSQFIDNTFAGINSSEDVFGGDGGYCFIDKDGGYMIVSYIYNTYAILAVPYTGAGAIIVEDQDSGSFINPADLDENLDILYAASSVSDKDSIARYSELFTSRVRTNFSDPLLIGEVTSIKVSPYTTNSTTLVLGTSAGKVLKVENVDTTPSWTDIDLNTSIDVGSVSCVEFGASELEIFVTLHNYGVENIWYTSDGGQTWSSKDGDFPDIPVKAIMKNPLVANEVIIGTNLGVWMTDNFMSSSPNWVQSQNGMSNVKVTSFDLRTSDNTVLASTYGRGMFTGKFLGGQLSIDEVEKAKQNIKIYPTISEGTFFVTSGESQQIEVIELYNANGKLVHQIKDRYLRQAEKLEVSVDLPQGVYFIHLKGEIDANFKTRIIIE